MFRNHEESLRVYAMLRDAAGAPDWVSVRVIDGDLAPTLEPVVVGTFWCHSVKVGKNFLAHYGLIHHFVDWGN